MHALTPPIRERVQISDLLHRWSEEAAQRASVEERAASPMGLRKRWLLFIHKKTTKTKGMMMSCRVSSRSLVRVALAPSLRGSAPALKCNGAALRRFASQRPVRRTDVSPAERAALRAARKERATKVMEQQQRHGAEGGGGGRASAETGGTTATASGKAPSLVMSRYIWYLSVGLPSALLFWGYTDENSPPARFSEAIGLTGFVRSYTDEIARPAHDKLLPDWSQVRW